MSAGHSDDFSFFDQQVLGSVSAITQQLKCTEFLQLIEHFANVTPTTSCDLQILSVGQTLIRNTVFPVRYSQEKRLLILSSQMIESTVPWTAAEAHFRNIREKENWLKSHPLTVQPSLLSYQLLSQTPPIERTPRITFVHRIIKFCIVTRRYLPGCLYLSFLPT